MAFAGCSGLRSVTVLNPAPPALGQLAFHGIDTAKACLYVPPGSADAYRSAAGWNAFRCIKDAAPPDTTPPGGQIILTKVSVDMVLVQGGTFTMGCTSNQGDCAKTETPARSVKLGDFYLGKYEVTQGLWTAVMESNPSDFIGNDNLPVEQVSWDDIQEFIGKLNAKTGKNYRLPTEAEWEYAARGGNIREGYAYSGGNNLDDVAWYNGNSGRQTHPVGTKRPNELGIHDMAGNVWEWVDDFYGTYPSFDEINPQGPPAGSKRVGRGGGWGNEAKYCRVSLRNNDSPGVRHRFLGFRLALSP
jgi:formylglycine-generating enzyme required for sulfatase activity